MAKVRIIPTRSDSVIEELKQLRLTTEKCYGPFGKAVLLQPVPGGHVTVTSYSGNVLQLVSPSTPVVQALVTTIQGHVNRYYDNGLFISLLSTNLLLKCIELDRPMQIASDVIGYLFKSIVNYIDSDSFPCKVVLDWGSSQTLCQLIRSQLATRPICSLTRTELDHVTSLILKAFVNVLPQHEGGGDSSLSAVSRVHVYTSVEGSASNSKLLTGVLVGNHFTHCCTDSLIVKKSENGVIATAVFGISLAGKQEDTECLDGVQVDATAAQYAEGYAAQQLHSLAVELINANVGFVGCQKCIHPAMRELLERNSIIVAEQLSAFHIDSVVDVTGGTMINSSSVPLDFTCLGHLRNVKIVSLAQKRHLLLEGFKIHSSLMIFSKSDSAGSELKSICTGIVSSLELGLTRPYLLCGGGCTETCIAYYITQKLQGGQESVVPGDLLCDKRSFSVIVKLVANVFSQVAQSLEHHDGLTLTDSSLHHCWSFPPYDHCLDMLDDSACFSAKKQCNCGSFVISDLPAGTEWLPVQSTRVFSDVIPERIISLLSKYATHDQSPQCAALSVPITCDMIEPKIAALTLVGDTTGLLLRTAFSLQT